jgi:hypothetical protein
MKKVLSLAILLTSTLACTHAAVAQSTEPALALPAHCAYEEPEASGVEFEENALVKNWTSNRQEIVWYGDLKTPCVIHANLMLQLPPGESVELRLSVSGQKMPNAKAIKLPTAIRTIRGDSQNISVDFGEFTTPQPGYWRFALSGVRKSGATFGSPVALSLSGKDMESANFNRSRWRSPASVHLGYPLPDKFAAVAAYAEVTATADPIHTYYCALGFRRGYFGIQVNGPHERRIIFSVWDAGNESVDRNKVPLEDRVQLLAKGDGVFTDSFGNEGTGGHSHLVYAWKTGQPQKFLVTARPEGKTTVYSGYFYFPEKKRWDLIASFRAPRDGAYLNGLYSFNEVFGGDYGQKQRRAEFSRQFALDVNGKWQELTVARFTHTARNEPLVRHDWSGGVLKDRFYLENGGFLTGTATYGQQFTRPTTKDGPPVDIPVSLMEKLKTPTP